jgi:uncharacterized protein YggU (UPF0235/DUF167 family)
MRTLPARYRNPLKRSLSSIGDRKMRLKVCARRRLNHHPRGLHRLGWRPSGAHTGVVRIVIWVRPGSARPGVGGEHDGALVVRVSERAADGRATAAALAAVAAAFGVRRHAVTLVAGASSRTKIVDVTGADQATLHRLLGL